MPTTHAPHPCTHGMPTPASCWECMEDGNLAPPPAEKTPGGTYEYAYGPYTSKYDSTCLACDDRIIADNHQIVTMVNDRGHKQYWHAACAGMDDAWREL